jgi:4a-hydroxytetrahydrobiopterin dehydratase
MTRVSEAEAQEQLPDWTVVDGRLELSVRAKDFTQAIEFVNRFTNFAEAQDHHPDFEIRYNTIRMRLLSHDVGHLTDRDIRFATSVDVLIEEMNLKRQPEKITRTQLVLVSTNVEAIKPFWQAVFDYKTAKNDENMIVDRSDVLPPIRFHQFTDTEASTEDLKLSGGLGKAHLDVFVPADQAQKRVQNAVEAGGKLLNDTDAPAEWELADMDGNRVFVRSTR